MVRLIVTTNQSRGRQCVDKSVPCRFRTLRSDQYKSDKLKKYGIHVRLIIASDGIYFEQYLTLLLSSSFNINRQHRRKVQLPSEKGTTNPTRRAVDAGNLPTTSRRRHALAVDIPQRRCATSIGVKRPRGDELSGRDV